MNNQCEDVFTALADATRRQILETLAAGESRTATQLAAEFPMTRQGVTKHLRLLSQANLVQTRRSGRETIYTFNPQPLTATSAWLAELTVQWDTRLQRLQDYLANDV
ncbi:MAG: metalloregulator ArsR/SmtB family transcription factor [Caldilineaceae bacterium]